MSKYNFLDFAQPDFDVESFVSPVEVEAPQKKGVPINAYKQFKAINRNGDAYYMSGVRHGQ